MMGARWLLVVPVLGCVGSWLVAAEPPLATAKPPARIAFGSCSHQDKPAPVWDAICEFRPDLFIFLGDNIYGDTEDMDVLRRKYQTLGSKPGYQRLKNLCPILPTWDDHDYGLNDGGAEYSMRTQSQRVFAEFFELRPESPVWNRPGVHDAFVFGPEDRRVQVILLDTRYFRGPLKRRPQRGNAYDGSPGPYDPSPDPAVTMLGPEQSTWLEEQLRVPARLRIIASSIQVVSDQHGWECWGNLPLERTRLFQTIRRSGAGGALFLSGDRHHAEISRLPPGDVPYPLYDVTSSGLTHGKGWDNEINPHRLGAMYREPNFGTIEIDWEVPDPLVVLAIRSPTGQLLLRHQLRSSEIH